MALRNIVLSGDEILRKISKPVTEFNKSLWDLLDDMYETMKKNEGCGIAGPQVAVLKRLIIVEANGSKFELVNPEITHVKGKWNEPEGCLSIKNIRGYVERPYEITVTGFDRYGNPISLTTCDWLARAICHEIDHLNGILFTDIMTKEIKYDAPRKNKQKKLEEIGD